MRKFKFGKLVRDKIVDQVISDGNKPNWHELSNDKFIEELKKKIVEESQEIPRTIDPAEVIKELADIQEIIDSILDALKVKKEDFLEIQKKKNDKAGSFKNKQYIEDVEVLNEKSEWLDYYLANPDKYPEVKK
jgi:predicted house-cleaning noncanonical NTP pyrophosphatase (MazG superfamily)